MGIDTTLITDNMAAHCMSKGMVSKVFAAADRVAMDGVVANKVGTLQLAICAHYFKIPFYILAYGGPDKRTLCGVDIPIEERDPREVLEFQGTPISGPAVKGYYPAFDLTPAGAGDRDRDGGGITTRRNGPFSPSPRPSPSEGKGSITPSPRSSPLKGVEAEERVHRADLRKIKKRGRFRKSSP